MGRYSKPRKLKTKRGQLKAEQNAWCLEHQIPMEKHGKNISCPGHWSTRIEITSRGKRTFAERSRLLTGQEKRRSFTRPENPFCLRCKIRMCRLSRSPLRYVCRNCNAAPVAHTERKGKLEEQKQAVIRLLRQGKSQTQIVRELHVHWSTVRALRPPDYLAAKSGPHKGHETHRTMFDELLVKVSRAIPRALFDEIRDELTSMILVDIAGDIDKRIKSVQDYIRQYKKMYPQRISLDADPTLAERIEG